MPANYPTNYDQRRGATLPPNRRELNLPIQGTKRMLCAIRLSVKWLQSALIFGHHNVKPDHHVEGQTNGFGQKLTSLHI